jgi:hypothetical protein
MNKQKTDQETIYDWCKEVEPVHIERAIIEARKMCHQPHHALTDQDRKEIRAFHAGLDWFLHHLRKELV